MCILNESHCVEERMQLQNEELQGRVAQLRVDNEELRSMVSNRESSILELQLNNDMLTARLADSAADFGPDPSQQVCPVLRYTRLTGRLVACGHLSPTATWLGLLRLTDTYDCRMLHRQGRMEQRIAQGSWQKSLRRFKSGSSTATQPRRSIRKGAEP